MLWRHSLLVVSLFFLAMGFVAPEFLSAYTVGLLSLALMFGIAAMAQTFLTELPISRRLATLPSS